MPGSRPRRGRDANTCLLQAALCERPGRAMSRARHQIRPTGRRPPDRDSGPDGTCCSPHSTHACALQLPISPRLDHHHALASARREARRGSQRRRRHKGSVSRYTWPRNLGHARVRRAKSRRDTHRVRSHRAKGVTGNVTTSRRNVPGRAAGAILVHRAGK